MVTRVDIIEQKGSFRLIRCSIHRYAVIEARGGLVYSMDGHLRRQSADTEAGMMDVVGADGWRDRDVAHARFDQLVKAGVRLAQKIR